MLQKKNLNNVFIANVEELVPLPIEELKHALKRL